MQSRGPYAKWVNVNHDFYLRWRRLQPSDSLCYFLSSYDFVMRGQFFLWIGLFGASLPTSTLFSVTWNKRVYIVNVLVAIRMLRLYLIRKRGGRKKSPSAPFTLRRRAAPTFFSPSPFRHLASTWPSPFFNETLKENCIIISFFNRRKNFFLSFCVIDQKEWDRHRMWNEAEVARTVFAAGRTIDSRTGCSPSSFAFSLLRVPWWVFSVDSVSSTAAT